MKKLILHVGMHKTGSTAIQASLAGYRDGVFEYAPLPPAVEADRPRAFNHSFFLDTAFDHQNRRVGKLLSFGVSPADFDRIGAQCRDALEDCLQRTTAEVLILSAETITGFDPEDTRALGAVLRRHAPDIQVYAYVRDPFEYVKSATQEAIKWGHAGKHPHHMSYRGNFGHLEEVFGAGNMSYRLYRRELLREGDVVSDFASWIGLKTNPARQLEVNTGLSTDAVRCLNVLNGRQVFPAGNALLHFAWRELMAALGQIFPGPFELPSKMVADGIDIWDLAWMETRLGQRLQLPPYCEKDMDCTDLHDWLGRISPEVPETVRRELTRRGADVPEAAGLFDLLFQLYLECIRSHSGGQVDYRRFSPERYLARYPDVRQAGLYPFGHYVLHGYAEGRDGS